MKNHTVLMLVGIIRHRACAQACKGVLVMLREFTNSFNVLVIFFEFNAFRGSRIPRLTGPPPRTTRNQYFLSPEHQKSIFSVPEHQINIFFPGRAKNLFFLSLEHQK